MSDAAPDPTTPLSERAPEPERVFLHMPVDVRSTALALIALAATLHTLHWASAVFIPLLLGLLFSYALTPLVDRLQRWRLPRALAAGVALLAVLAGLGSMTWSLSDDATALVASLPDAADKVRNTVRSQHGAPEGAIDKVQRAAARLEQAAEESGAAPSTTTKGVTRVQIEKPHFNVKDYLWSGTLGLAALVGQAVVVCFIAYFLLASGDRFRRKMVRIAGPTLSQKKVTLQVLDEITGQIHRYLWVQVITSAGVGVVTWLALLWIGLDRAAVWGVVAAVLNLVPYLGSIALAVGLALVGFVQFGSLQMALLTSGVSLLIHTISGNLITPWLTSKASQLSPVAVFVGALAWGWLWGIWGLLLGVPLLMVAKAVCDRVDELKPIGEWLGD